VSNKIFWCSSCLNMSTRPRIEFDSQRRCNACVWTDEKKSIDWSLRQEELKTLLNKHRSKKSDRFDCMVPVSGGKDGSYVAYMLKHKYNMNPLTITIKPALPLDIGEQNLNNFINSGYDHIAITPNKKIMQQLNKHGFIEKGFPYYGWLIAIKSAVIQTAMNFKIPLIFYGEDGEVEYGGSTESKNTALYNVEYMKRVYFEGGYDKVINIVRSNLHLKKSELSFWRFPTNEQIDKNDLAVTHWSYFENWDSYRNYICAKEHCGLIEKEEGTSGTFTNFAQNDQALCELHYYLMYLKFGFGRATQDAGIEIRRGAMTREQAVNLTNLYDNNYPVEFIDQYLDYYEMTEEEFQKVLNSYANKNLFELINGVWQPKFSVGEDFYI